MGHCSPIGDSKRLESARDLTLNWSKIAGKRSGVDGSRSHRAHLLKVLMGFGGWVSGSWFGYNLKFLLY